MATNSMSGLHVGISGSYGGINLGDEAILQSLLAQLRSTLEPRAITVFTRDPADTLARHAVDRAVAVREMTREEARAEIRQLDLFILGGGGLLYDQDAAAYLREVALAHEAGIPVVVYAIRAFRPWCMPSALARWNNAARASSSKSISRRSRC